LLAFAGEFSPSDRLTVIPSLDYALTPNLWQWVPATTVGLGVPVQVTPDLSAGARAQVSVTWPVFSLFSVGLSGMLDLLFRSNGRPLVLAGGVLQVGL
jgi:hypothetical protein